MIGKPGLVVASVAALAAGLALTGGSAVAAELTFASPAGARQVMNREVFVPWVLRVAKMSGGSLTIKMLTGGALPDTAADIGWGAPGDGAKLYPRTALIEMPDVGQNPLDTTRRLWTAYEKHLAVEYGHVRVIAVWARDAPILHTKNKLVARVGDLKGMRIATSSRHQARLIAALGATPVPMPAAGLYNAIDRSMIAGVLIRPSAIDNLKLDEVTKFHTTGIPWGRAPAFVVMNRKSYSSLSRAHRDIIDKTTGRALSLKASRIQREAGVKGLKALGADRRRHVSKMSGLRAAAATALLKAAEAKIVSDLGKKAGFDAAGVLAALRGAGR